MDEIKTGVEIYDAIDEATGNRVPELVKQKWVSVDWLKQEIFKKHIQKLNSTEDHYYNKALGDIVSLLKE